MAGKNKLVTIKLMVVVLPCLAVQSLAAGGAGMVVIDQDTLWQGHLVFDRPVIISKGANLTISPGTRIEFLRRDTDGDGIGDAKLRVEGRIIARGTREDPIVFTSGEEEPRAADWKFLIIEFSRDSLLEYCSFSYAFSGVQVHYSTARVANCLFRDNIDGFRFSTANVQVEHCLMEGNVNGVRYEERKSRSVIRWNIIRNNLVGIFSVTEGEGTTEFRENNIYGNEQYNYKMGFLQKKDIRFGENWWGTADTGAIAETVYDKEDDPNLGRLFFEPVSPVEISPAGPDIE